MGLGVLLCGLVQRLPESRCLPGSVSTREKGSLDPQVKWRVAADCNGGGGSPEEKARWQRSGGGRGGLTTRNFLLTSRVPLHLTWQVR